MRSPAVSWLRGAGGRVDPRRAPSTRPSSGPTACSTAWRKMASCRIGSAARTGNSAPLRALINLIVILQIATIVISRGDVYMLGEAYAFGVVWSFAMKALSVLVLRYKQPGRPRMEGAVEFPLPRRRDCPWPGPDHRWRCSRSPSSTCSPRRWRPFPASASPSPSSSVFELSEIVQPQAQARPRAGDGKVPAGYARRCFRAGAVSVRPGNVLVAVRNPNRLHHLARVLAKTDTRKHGHRGAFRPAA